MPAGATQVSFWAWGATGTEFVKFEAASCDPVLDGVCWTTGDITLNSTPTQYTFDITGSGLTDVYVPFLWVTGGAPIGSAMVFYVDDLVWE